MPRYATRPRAEADCDWWANDAPAPLTVCDHEAVDTGLLDARGETIWRMPNPIGFGRDEDW